MKSSSLKCSVIWTMESFCSFSLVLTKIMQIQHPILLGFVQEDWRYVGVIMNYFTTSLLFNWQLSMCLSLHKSVVYLILSGTALQCMYLALIMPDNVSWLTLITLAAFNMFCFFNNKSNYWTEDTQTTALNRLAPKLWTGLKLENLHSNPAEVWILPMTCSSFLQKWRLFF